jgi:hypothetical protein
VQSDKTNFESKLDQADKLIPICAKKVIPVHFHPSLVRGMIFRYNNRRERQRKISVKVDFILKIGQSSPTPRSSIFRKI